MKNKNLFLQLLSVIMCGAFISYSNSNNSITPPPAAGATFSAIIYGQSFVATNVAGIP